MIPRAISRHLLWSHFRKLCSTEFCSLEPAWTVAEEALIDKEDEDEDDGEKEDGDCGAAVEATWFK